MMNLSIGQLDLASPRNEGYDAVQCFVATGYRPSLSHLEFYFSFHPPTLALNDFDCQIALTADLLQ